MSDNPSSAQNSQQDADDVYAETDPVEEVGETRRVNHQILKAVQASTEFAFGLNNQLQASKGTDRLSAGVAIAYDKAAQAAALAVQDATDYERNVLSIASAAQGKALAMILAGTNVQDAAVAFVLAIVSSVMAPLVAGEVGIAQTNMLKNFPQG